MIGFTPQPLYPRYPLDRRLCGPQSQSGRGKKILYPTVIRIPTRRSSSQSLYRLRYAGSCITLRVYRSNKCECSWTLAGFIRRNHPPVHPQSTGTNSSVTTKSPVVFHVTWTDHMLHVQMSRDLVRITDLSLITRKRHTNWFTSSHIAILHNVEGSNTDSSTCCCYRRDGIYWLLIRTRAKLWDSRHLRIKESFLYT
jgi:hypothetical protein